jgi:broad specificity phosphatase PhoE
MSIEITYFVHGTTYDNAEGKCSGWKQVQLNELGIQQSIDLGKNCKPSFDVIFTSDLVRAIDSANLSWPNFTNKKVDKRLRECNYGDYDGESKSLVVYEDHITNPFPNGEALIDVEKRMRDFVDYLKENYDGKKVGIVAHRSPQLALEVITKEITWEEAIKNDWRKIKAWKPGWTYIIK